MEFVEKKAHAVGMKYQVNVQVHLTLNAVPQENLSNQMIRNLMGQGQKLLVQQEAWLGNMFIHGEVVTSMELHMEVSNQNTENVMIDKLLDLIVLDYLYMQFIKELE